MTDKNKYFCRWHDRKSVYAIFIVFFIALLAWSGSAHAQANHPRASYLKGDNTPDIQKNKSTIIQPHKENQALTAKLHKQVDDLRNSLHLEVTRWGNAHKYHNTYNKISYPLDYEYNQVQGFGTDVDKAVKDAHSMSDNQASLKLITDNLAHLHAMESDAVDKTPWSQAHASDLTLIHYYHLSGKVVIISFIEQTCRVYQDGKLIKAFQVTTGNFDSPSPAGLWHIFLRQSPTIFRSPAPYGSPFWYPNTPINYAMEYHAGGYYLHDSWWRTTYGPGTNFPHYDPNGNRYAAEGSHGCINMLYVNAAWMYANTGYGTAVITY